MLDLSKLNWHFAKTMPEIPHEYVVKGSDLSAKDWYDLANTIRMRPAARICLLPPATLPVVLHKIPLPTQQGDRPFPQPFRLSLDESSHCAQLDRETPVPRVPQRPTPLHRSARS
jgi:hypothetical protein